jgi:demethylmenaquinone methyltransferase/2-methoxy-6-polyprenyl-1,4-benzoquinol methylase
MFGRIAHRYDLANRVLSLGIDKYWRFRLVAAVKNQHPGDILDLATGSGDVAFALERGLPAGANILGMDFCEPMLDQAMNRKARDPGSHARLSFAVGDGLAIPAPAESFDAVTIAFGLRNMADRKRCLQEMLRVLRPGGRLFVLEFSQCWSWVRPIYAFHLRWIVPAAAGLLTGDRAAYKYLGDTIGAFPGKEAISREILEAGFASVRARSMTAGIVALHEARRAAELS